jgi:ABC-type siderophore export system fused ATPase/permease subunit
LQNLRGRLTIVAISHQEALVKIADKTYHVQDGKIVTTEDRSGDGFHNRDSDAEPVGKPRVAINPEKAL